MPAPDPAALAPYASLKEKAQRLSEPGDYFICEGRLLADEAIRASRQGLLRLVSLLCSSKHAEEWAAKLPSGAQLLALAPGEMDSLVGFRFHRGVLCCCAVPSQPSEELLLQSKRLLVLPQIDNIDNLGQLIRSAAALGMGAILLGKGPSPFARRCVRVSMGAVWKIPIFRCENPIQLLDSWLCHAPDIESEIVGTAPHPNAEPASEWMPAQRTALALGPESQGMDEKWHPKCTKHVRIPMAREINSLNVSAAGAILMGRMAAPEIYTGLQSKKIIE
jgi:tRNA G18 (ribose-2'-O)-methylase SpoU